MLGIKGLGGFGIIFKDFLKKVGNKRPFEVTE